MWLAAVTLVAAGGYVYAQSGAGRAYLDIAQGEPKYFVLTGAANDRSLMETPEVRALSKRGVKIVNTGCVEERGQDAYNAVIARHFGE